MSFSPLLRCASSLSLLLVLAVRGEASEETIWLEAEHLDGIQGYCWTLGKPEMQKTNGHWGLSGPGWAAAWNQGGESGFLSIAAGADDDKAVAAKSIEVPADGKYFVWVRYADWREQTERFQIRIEQEGKPTWTGKYGETPVVEEDNEMKLYWGWAFGWDKREATLKRGAAKLSLTTTTKDPVPRQVDVIVLTTDAAYRPLVKDRPKNYAWEVLDGYRKGIADDVEPLARNLPDFKLPAAWKVRTFQNKGFRYLWNVSPDKPTNWLTDDPNRVLFPYNVNDEDTRTEFEKKYSGSKDVPIFSDPRIVPTFHGAGAAVFATDPKTGELLESGKRFAKWLDAHPDRDWAMMMNYADAKPIGDKGQAQFQKVRDRYIGSISGESLGYFDVDAKKMHEATANATTRRQLAEAITKLSLEANAAKYKRIYGKDLEPNPYADVIPCPSVGNTAFTPLAFDWGAQTVGYESSAMSSGLLGMRLAFLRGAARQHGGMTATYRSCNFGDASTIFSIGSSFSSPRNILDNYYSVFSGAGMTWYKMDIWYQYMAGSSMFYHEQGFDEFWKPGGTTAAGVKEVQLSPKGKLVDRFLRVTAQHTDRGAPYTPVAFLVDYAHGWEPAPFWPNAFNDLHNNPDRFHPGDHEKMLEAYFWTAYHPIGPESARPITGTNEVYLPGVFGDIFDVIYAYPDVKKWRTLDSYPVVIASGDIELIAAEGERLAEYVQKGGTLFVAAEHLTGSGAQKLNLPQTGAEAETAGYRWLNDKTEQPSQRFRYRSVVGGRPLATTLDGKVFCAAFDQGKGRLIYLSVPHGLGIDRAAHPVLGRLMASLTRGVMPVEVRGEVEWLVNRTDSGWIVTLLNPAGQDKPQQGITPTDYRQNRTVTIRTRTAMKSAADWLFPEDKLIPQGEGKGSALEVVVPAGGVRIVEFKER